MPIASNGVLLRAAPGGVLRRFDPRSGRLIWRTATTGLDESGAVDPQVVADGEWFQSKGEDLVAYDIARGSLVWSRSFTCFHCGVAALGGRIYAAGSVGPGTPAGELFALDARTGATIWSTAGKAAMTTVSSPLLVAGRVLVVTTNSQPTWTFDLEAFRASDGAPLWNTALGGASGFWFEAPAADASLTVYPVTDGYLYALDTATGRLRWRIRVGAPGDSPSTPAIANGIVWDITSKNQLTAFAATDGHPLWRSSPIPGLLTSTPVIADRYVLVSAPDGRVLAYTTRSRGSE